LCGRLPQNITEPTEKTASPAVVWKYTMSARINACGRLPVTVVDDADEGRAIEIAQFAGYLLGDRLTRTGREPVDITNQRNHSGGLCRARSAKRYRGLSLGYRNEPSERHAGSNIGASAMTAIDLDQQLVELRSAADAYAARHQFIPDLTWPEGVRVAVNFTCGFDAMLPHRLLNEPPMQLAKGEFGGRVGIWRLIELFDVHGVKATIPGDARHRTLSLCGEPEAVRRVLAADPGGAKKLICLHRRAFRQAFGR
jgi:hypothetical protein